LPALEAPPPTEGHLIRWAFLYDGVVNLFTLGQARRLRNMTIDHALLGPGESFLDVGCGTGGVTIPGRLRVGREGKAAGIDPAPEMIATARKKAARRGLEIDFRVGVIEALPYPDGTFDAVTSSLMMHHLPRDLQVKGLAEIYRVLKPGGRLLIADVVRPQAFLWKRLMALHASHEGLVFGIEDLPELSKAAGFAAAAPLDARFLFVGFVRAVKRPLAE
jgi:ubiquinone/menaquinone biosynthesis C-methylase UbiE